MVASTVSLSLSLFLVDKDARGDDSKLVVNVS